MLKTRLLQLQKWVERARHQEIPVLLHLQLFPQHIPHHYRLRVWTFNLYLIQEDPVERGFRINYTQRIFMILQGSQADPNPWGKKIVKY